MPFFKRKTESTPADALAEFKSELHRIVTAAQIAYVRPDLLSEALSAAARPLDFQWSQRPIV
jgi:hypothetical protein